MIPLVLNEIMICIRLSTYPGPYDLQLMKSLVSGEMYIRHKYTKLIVALTYKTYSVSLFK